MRRFGRAGVAQKSVRGPKTFGLAPHDYSFAVSLLKSAGDRASFAESARIMRGTGIAVSDNTVERIAHRIGFAGRGHGAWGKEHRRQVRLNEVFAYAAQKARLNPQTGKSEVALSIKEIAREFGGQEKRYSEMLPDLEVLLKSKGIVVLRKNQGNVERYEKKFDQTKRRVFRFVETMSLRGVAISPRVVRGVFRITPPIASKVLGLVASDAPLAAKLARKGKKVLIIPRVPPGRFNIVELRERFNKD